MKFLIYRDAAGEFRWTLKTRNNKKIADSSEGYKRNPKKAIEKIIAGIGSAKIVERNEGLIKILNPR